MTDARKTKPAPFALHWMLVCAGAVPTIAWLWLCYDRPARLGFFCDDWLFLLHPMVGTATALRDMFGLASSRPVSAPFIWFVQLVVDWSPYTSQLLNSAMLGLTAASVGALSCSLASLAGFSRESRFVAGSLTATAFICFPSNVGTFAWSGGMVAVVPATPLFCLGMVLLLRWDSRVSLACGALLLVASHLSYEAFYLQEITILALAAILGRKKISSPLLRRLAIAIILNAACIAFNRLMPSGIQKTFNDSWWLIFVHGYSRIPDLFDYVVREYIAWAKYALIATSILGFLSVGVLVGFFRTIVGILALCSGVAAAGALYALAGYGLTLDGPMARVAIVIAVYFAVGIGILSAAAWENIRHHRALSFMSLFAVILLLCSLAATSRLRLDEWADTWSQETARLARLPAEVQYFEDDSRIYLAVHKDISSPVPVAAAPWEISGAVAWAVYERSTKRDRRLTIDGWDRGKGGRWYATPSAWFNRWNGEKFEQGFCSGAAVIYQRTGKELWVWDTSAAELQRVNAPWQVGC